MIKTYHNNKYKNNQVHIIFYSLSSLKIIKSQKPYFIFKMTFHDDYLSFSLQKFWHQRRIFWPCTFYMEVTDYLTWTTEWGRIWLTSRGSWSLELMSECLAVRIRLLLSTSIATKNEFQSVLATTIPWENYVFTLRAENYSLNIHKKGYDKIKL